MQEKQKLGLLILSIAILMLNIRPDREEAQSLMSKDETQRILQTYNVYKTKLCGSTGTFTLTQDQKDFYTTQTAAMKNIQPKNPLESYIKSSDTSGFVSLAYLAAPFVVFFVLSVLGCWCCILCCCCDCCCPPCKCCRRDYQKKPITKCEINCPIVFLFLLSILLFVIGIMGITSQQQLPTALQNMKCTTVALSEDLLLGNKDNANQIWMGTVALGVNLQTIGNNLVNQISKIQNQVSDTSWVNTQSTQITNSINTVANFRTQVIVRPDDQTQSQVQNQCFMAGPVTGGSAYISWRLNTNAFAQITAVSTFLTGLSSGLQVLTPITSSVSSTVLSGVNSINSMNTALDDFHETSYTYANQYFSIIQDGLILATTIFFALMIVMAGINVFAGFVMLIKPNKKIRYMFHITWCILGLLSILLFLIMIILYPLTFVLFDVCQILQTVIASKAGMDYYGLSGGSITTYTNPCLWDGNGDITASFGVQSQLNQINTVTSNFNGFLNSMNSGSSSFKDVNGITNTILNAEITLVAPQIVGTYTNVFADVNGTTTNPQNGAVAINSLNAYTQQGQSTSSGGKTTSLQTGTCLSVDDLFVYDSGDCTSGYTVYNNATATATFNVGSKTCIPVIQVSTSDITTRYSSYCAISCLNSLSWCTQINTRFANIKAHDNSRRGAYQTLSTAISNTKSLMLTFNTQLTNQVAPLSSIATTVNSFVSSVTTVMAQLNCKFLYTNFQNLINSLCVAFVPSFYYMVQLVAIGAFGFFFSVFFAYLIAMKTSKMPDSGYADTSKVEMEKFNSNNSQVYVQPGTVPIQPIYNPQYNGGNMRKY